MISLKEAFTVVYKHYKRELTEDVDFVTSMLLFVKARIALYLGNEPWRSVRMAYLSGVGSTTLISPFPHFNHLISCVYSADRDFDNEDEVSVRVINGKVYFETAYAGDNVVRIIADDGYVVIDYQGADAPALVVPDYSQVVDPFLAVGNTVAATDIWFCTSTWKCYLRNALNTAWDLHPEYTIELLVGQHWKDSNGIIRGWTGSDWQLYSYRVDEMPDYLKLACIEYLVWLARRISQGSTGIVKLERGYSFEGAAIGAEGNIPAHVREILDSACGVQV